MEWGVESNAVCTRAAGGWAQVHPRTHTAFAAAVSRGGWSCGIGGGVRGWGEGGEMRSQSDQAFNGWKGPH